MKSLIHKALPYTTVSAFLFSIDISILWTLVRLLFVRPHATT